MGFFGALGSLQLSPRVLKIHVDSALAAVRVGAGERILDAGCGPGLWSAYLLRRFPEARLLGLDIAPERIADCRALGLGERASFEVADLHRLELLASFELIVCMNAIHYAGMDDAEIFARLARALAADGRLLFVGPMTWTSQPLHGAHVREDPGYAGYTLEGLRAKVAAAGLRDLALRPIVGPLGTAAKEIARRVQPHPLWKALSYPFLAGLALADACLPAGARAYYLLGLFARTNPSS